VALETSEEVEYHYDRLQNPERVFVDLFEVNPGLEFRGIGYSVPVEDGLVRRIRVALNQKGVTRVVVDLDGPAQVSASQLTSPPRVVLEFRRWNAPAAPPSPSPGQLETRTPAPPVPEPAVSPQPVREEPKRIAKTFVPPPLVERKPQVLSIDATRLPLSVGRPRLPTAPKQAITRLEIAPPPQPVPVDPPARPSGPLNETNTESRLSAGRGRTPAVTPPPADPRVPLPAQRDNRGARSLTRVLGLKLNRVVLDPGHGGHDTGTMTKTVVEKDLVLDISLRLGALLRERLGTEVAYTRQDDRFIPLEARTQAANSHRADLFLSIHANSSPYRSIAGSETFFLSLTAPRVDLDLAARENASSEKSIHELADLLKQIALQDKINESREFAARIQAATHELAVKSNGRILNRGVKKAPFVVLIGASMPAVLTEVAFLTNPREEALLAQPEHRQKIAEALYKGIVGYAETLSRFSVARGPEAGGAGFQSSGVGNTQ
jgi:N-acetylmuramoyl-L-alanine amidase